MRKYVIAAALAAASMPSQAAVLVIDGDFGPTTTGPAAAGIHFELEWEFFLNEWESMGRARASLIEPILGPFGIANISAPPQFFITRGFAFGLDYYKIVGNLQLFTGELIEVLFALDKDGNALAPLPPEFNSVRVLTPGSTWSQNYHWTGPTPTNVVFDPSIFSSPVPEPATWGMMIAGLAAVGAQMRRRKVSVSFA
jgi:hypothetical protein